jgi:hypothetical protein
MLGRTQATDFSPFVDHFFARRGEKMIYKRKYHAAVRPELVEGQAIRACA